jgi:hypothetical protein
LFGLGLLILLLANVTSPVDPAAAAASLVTPIAVSAPADCVRCENGGDGEDETPFCFPSEHDAWDTFTSDEHHTRNGGAHIGEPYCRSQNCFPSKHAPTCSNEVEGQVQLTDADLERLRSSIVVGDVNTVRSMVATHGSLNVNTKRAALQLLDCQGSVTMHLPLPAAVARALSRGTSVVE